MNTPPANEVPPTGLSGAGGSRPILVGQAEEIPEPKPDLTRLQMRIEKHLEAIEKVLGPKYCLTLVANYIGPDRLDADIVLTMSTRDRVIAAVERFVPASSTNTKLADA